MVHKAEDFASEDEANRKCIEALNSLSSFVYDLKSQLVGQSGLGGKLSDEDKKALLSTIKEATKWVKDNGQTVGTNDLEGKEILLLTINSGWSQWVWDGHKRAGVRKRPPNMRVETSRERQKCHRC